MTPQSGGGGVAGATFGLGVLSSAISGFGKYEQGQEQKQAYDYNAAVTTINTDNQVQANTQKFAEMVGRQGTAYAGAGVDIASGSPLLIMAATAARGAQQGEQIKQAGDEEAALQRYYGKIAAFGGTMAGIGSFLSGVSSAATGYATATAKPSTGYSSSRDQFDGDY